MGRLAEDLTGRKFEKWIVEERAGSRASGNAVWLCRCECGLKRRITAWNLTNDKSVQCRSCSKKKGHGGISGKFWYDFRRGAERRALEWTITIESAWELFVQQGGMCALSGLPIDLPPNQTAAKTRAYTASLDRIDSARGYVVGNVQWVHKHINMMKQSFEQNYFVELCRRVAATT